MFLCLGKTSTRSNDQGHLQEEPALDSNDQVVWAHLKENGKDAAVYFCYRLGGDASRGFDGLGWRDHSWGPRYWTNIWFYRLLIANFGPDRAMMLLKITGRDGVTRREGVLQFDGDYEEISDLDIITDWTDKKDPEAMRINVRTPKRAVTMEGEVLTRATLRNRRKGGDEALESRIAEGLTWWHWDGREGLGMSEYIEFLDNGEPVGYPL